MTLFLNFLSYFLGIQLIFWGLNGFFNWISPPPSGPVFERFVKACYEVRFIMPTVKIFELMGGVLLMFSMTQEMGLQLLAPIIFVITGLQIFHHPKPWPVLGMLCFPFWILYFFSQIQL